ncbi:MAG: isochorismatase family cysteine hydrolase, partial [Candidatus Komeilibacteria bacterium]
INQLIDYCRQEKYQIIFIQHIEKNSTTAFAENSQNIDLVAGLHCEDTDIIVKKNKISAFYKTDLAASLNNVKKIVIGGLLTNLCVRSLAQDAYDRDFAITLITNCCQANNEETHDFTINDLQETREEIKFLTLSQFIKEQSQNNE